MSGEIRKWFSARQRKFPSYALHRKYKIPSRTFHVKRQRSKPVTNEFSTRCETPATILKSKRYSSETK